VFLKVLLQAVAFIQFRVRQIGVECLYKESLRNSDRFNKGEPLAKQALEIKKLSECFLRSIWGRKGYYGLGTAFG